MPFPAILDDLSLVLFLEARKFVSLNKEIYTQILTFEIRLFSRDVNKKPKSFGSFDEEVVNLALLARFVLASL